MTGIQKLSQIMPYISTMHSSVLWFKIGATFQFRKPIADVLLLLIVSVVAVVVVVIVIVAVETVMLISKFSLL